MKTKIKDLEEVINQEEKVKQDKRESLKEFSRVSEEDAEVIEEVKEVLVDEKVAQLKQAILDDEAEIARREESKAISLVLLAKYER